MIHKAKNQGLGFMRSFQALHVVFILLCLSPFALQASSQCATVFSMQADKLTDKIPQFFRELGYAPSYRQNLFYSVSRFFRSYIAKGKPFLILRKGEMLPETVFFVSLKYPEEGAGQPILTVRNKEEEFFHLSPQDINSIGHPNTLLAVYKKLSQQDKSDLKDSVDLNSKEDEAPLSLQKKLIMQSKGDSFYKDKSFEIFLPPNFLKDKENAQSAHKIKQAVEKFILELEKINFLHVENERKDKAWPFHHIIVFDTPSARSGYTLWNKKNEYVVVLNANSLKSRLSKLLKGDMDIVSVTLHELAHNYIGSLAFRLFKIRIFETIEEALSDYMPHLYAGYSPVEMRDFKNLSTVLYDKRSIEGFDLLSSHIPRAEGKFFEHQQSIFISHFLYQMEQVLGTEIMKAFFRDFVHNLIESSSKLQDFIKTDSQLTTYKPIIETFYTLAVFSRTLDENTTYDPQKIDQAQKFLAPFKEEMGSHPFLSGILYSK